VDSSVTTAELARLAAEPLPTINYWTRVGLLLVKERRGRKRLYDPESSLARSRKIRELQRSAYPLEQIRDMLDEDDRIRRARAETRPPA